MPQWCKLNSPIRYSATTDVGKALENVFGIVYGLTSALIQLRITQEWSADACTCGCCVCVCVCWMAQSKQYSAFIRLLMDLNFNGIEIGWFCGIISPVQWWPIRSCPSFILNAQQYYAVSVVQERSFTLIINYYRRRQSNATDRWNMQISMNLWVLIRIKIHSSRRINSCAAMLRERSHFRGVKITTKQKAPRTMN